MKQAYYALGSLAARLERQHPLGRSIFSEDWDICIILDSARVDLLRDVWPETAAVDAVWSRGSLTTEWLANTFRHDVYEAIGETAYVTASPHSATVFDDRSYLTNADEVDIPFPDAAVVEKHAFAGFHEVWRTHATEHGAVPPATMRDATLEAANRYDRVVAHWLQPHEPFIAPNARLVGGHATDVNVWDGLNAGRLDTADVWQSYRATCVYALAFLEQVLEAVDGQVLITADHGNAFGEWGIYGHPFAWPQPEVRKVPWILTTAEQTRDLDTAGVLNEASGATVNRDEQLRALGYR